MNKQNNLGINENVSKQSIFKTYFILNTYAFTDLKKTLGLDNIPKFMRLFGLTGFCVSICYLLLCPFCCPDRWVVALFQIILFGGIYYIGDKNAIPR